MSAPGAPAAPEEILFPDLAICDSHHHLWSRPGYPYLLEDYLADALTGHRIVSTIFVECGTHYDHAAGDLFAPVGETAFAARESARAAEIPGAPQVSAGIVAFADLARGGQVSSTLDAHRAVSPRFVGIRHCAAIDPDPAILSAAHSPVFAGMLNDARFREGFALLAPRGLVFDAWIYHGQLVELAALADAFPETAIVLDHLGGPLGIGPYRDRRAEVFAHWRAGLTRLAERPNVSVKLGGICMPLNGWQLHKRAEPVGSEELAAILRDHLLTAIDLFGVDRCLFESNFPADKPSVGYAVLWNAYKCVVADFPLHERQRLFHDTAHRLYRLADQ